MNVCVVFDILLIVHGIFCYLFVGFLHLLLLVHHAACSGAVYALAFVHVRCLQILGQAGPSIARAMHNVMTATHLVIKNKLFSRVSMPC